MKINIEIAGRRVYLFYIVLLIVVMALTFAVMALLQNIAERKREAKQFAFEIVKITEDTIDPNEWGKNFPRQFDGYKRTVDTIRTTYGGSEAFSKLEADPRWLTLFKGYSFSIDYREERGHAYMLSDQTMTERVKKFKQPGACLNCHSSVLPAYRQKAKEAGFTDTNNIHEQMQKGFELLCAMPYQDARKLVTFPISCVDCHEPVSMNLRVTRPAFRNAIAALAKSDFPLPQYASIERWRKGNRNEEYNPNELASRQEMRTFVCGQCHVEYYFKGVGQLLTYPWHNGLRAEQAEQYYDQTNFKDWVHPDSNAPLLKAQHPEFDLWSQGIHSRSGVACADCHMAYKREGAVKISDHHVKSPLLNVNNSCQVCHHYPESELIARAEGIQEKISELLIRSEDAVLALIKSIQEAQRNGANDEQLNAARQFHRKAQWRLDYVSAENSTGFHAPQEAARLLAESIDYARRGQTSVANIQAK